MRRSATRPGGTGGRLVGTLAWLAVVAIVVAAPVLLRYLADNPLPGRVPTIDELAHLLTRPDDGTMLLRMVALTGWLAWAALAGSVLLELGAQVAGRRAPRILGRPQRLAQLLVAAALASWSAPGVSPADAAYVAAEPLVAAAADPVPVALAAPVAPLAPAVAAPAEATMVHEVAPGDWMWHIAGRYLGDEQRYRDIAALNPQLAERYLDFPDHIRPGDRLVLPADAHDRGERPHATGPVTGNGAAPPPPPPSPAESPAEPPAEPPGEPSTESPREGSPTEGSPAGAPAEEPAAEPVPGPDRPGRDPGTGAAAPGGDPAVAGPADATTAEPASAEFGAPRLLTAGMAAAVLLGAVALHRARKSARRRYRRIVTAPGDAPAEATALAAAAADVTRLDHALRALAAVMPPAAGAPTDRPGPLPDVGAVWVAGGDIHLVLAAPWHRPPPAPFQAADAGTWLLPAAARLPATTGVLAPLPTLVTVAAQPGRHLLLDLERHGIVTIVGDPTGRDDLLRHIAAELAHNPWSDQVEVTLAGFPAAQAELLASLNPQRVRVATDPVEAAQRLRRRLAHTTAALATHGLVDAGHGRAAAVAADTWTPQLLLVHRIVDGLPWRDLADELVRTGRRCAVAVVAGGGEPAPGGGVDIEGQLRVTGDGGLQAEFLAGAGDLRAAALPEQLLAPLVELVRGAAEPDDHPVPPAREPWAAGTDATGGPLLATADTADVLRADTPTLPLPTITGAEAEDLDAALVRWRRGTGPSLALLGPLHIAAPGPAPARWPRISAELVAFLAAKGSAGATADEVAAALWPDRPPPVTVRTEVMNHTRRWLGDTADAEPWLGEADAEGRYRLRAGFLVDWHLFRRLRTRARRAGAPDDLKAALALVRGMPWDAVADPATTRAPYRWLPGSPFAPDLVRAGVVDTAHELVDRCLAAGDPATARWAVRQAWLVDPGRHDDHPWRDLLRIADAEGGSPDEVIAELLRWRDLDHPDELSPATRELVATLRRRQPATTKGAS